MYLEGFIVETYMGYELNDNVYSYTLSQRQLATLDMAVFLVDNKCTIRQVCREFLVSKSEFHRRIHEVLRCTSYELYCCVIRQLRLNKKKFFNVYRR